MDIAINGTTYQVADEPDRPLLWVLRDELGLTGTKFGCGVVKYDGIILAVVHDIFKGNGDRLTLEGLEGHLKSAPVLVDIRRYFDGEEAITRGFYYRTL